MWDMQIKVNTMEWNGLKIFMKLKKYSQNIQFNEQFNKHTLTASNMGYPDWHWCQHSAPLSGNYMSCQ